jgi:hypothetical protein
MWDRIVVGLERRVLQGGWGSARRRRVLPDTREFRSPGSAWRKGKQERIFFSAELIVRASLCHKINAGICVSFSLSFYSIACVGIKMWVFMLVSSGEFGAGIVARR